MQEIADRLENLHRKRMFYESEKVLEFYETLPAIETIRDRYATLTFFKQTSVYFVFLILLTAGKILKRICHTGNFFFNVNLLEFFGETFLM